MNTTPDGRPKVSLCEICSNIDFEDIAVASRACNSRGHGVSPVDDKDFGTIEDIELRKDRCEFCALIARHSLDLPGRYKLSTQLEFCASSDQDQDILEGVHTHTTIAQLQLYPEEILSWAPAPWEIQSHDSHAQSVQHIFDLQAAYSAHQDDLTKNPLRIFGRQVLPSIDTNLLKRWLAQCEELHAGRCPHSTSTPIWESNFMPAFVIDTEYSCITQTPPECRYVALSYVWGRGTMFKHTVTNSAALRTPGSLQEADVPKTVRDAILLVNAIGEKYLWVDALCIIQDSAIMQQTQIAKMDKIYAKALFTVVAACGDDAEAGLPGTGLTQRKQAQDIVHLPGRDFYTLICNTTEKGNTIKQSTWGRRAWTMQEHLCSGRCLIFTPTQIYWRCQCATWLEELALEETSSTSLEIFHYTASFRFPTHELNRYEYFRLYANLLKAYLQRHLSFQSDRLNAFSGICARLSSIQDDRYIWGLPQSQFSRSLGWEFLRGQHNRHNARARLVDSNGAVQEIPFPSWSWTAWETVDNTPYFSFHRSKSWSANFAWNQRVQGSGKWHRDGNEFHPVVDFWIADEQGMIVPVDEPGTHGRWIDTYDTEHRFSWQSSEREIPEALVQLDKTVLQRRPGMLYFWTSVATMKLGSQEGLVPVHLLTPEPVTQCLEMQELERRAEDDAGAEIMLDFVVVGRTDELKAENPVKDLLVLTVEWRGGIAYSLGSRMVKESHWLALEQKRWNFVILG